MIASAAFALLSLAAVLLQPRREHVAGHAYAIPKPDKRIRVEVLNGTQRAGLALRPREAFEVRRAAHRGIARWSTCS